MELMKQTSSGINYNIDRLNHLSFRLSRGHSVSISMLYVSYLQRAYALVSVVLALVGPRTLHQGCRCTILTEPYLEDDDDDDDGDESQGWG